VVEKLKAAPSETLRGSDLRVWVSDDREVTLDGAVRGAEDFTLGGRLPARCRAWLTCVIDLSWCRRRRQIRSSTKGSTFLDAGDYSSAIDCFRKASADPNNRAAKDLLDQAVRAQQTEEELLRTGSNVLPVGAPQRLAFTIPGR